MASEELDKKETFDLIQKLETIFDTKLHSVLGAFVRSNTLIATLKWIGSQISKC
jgi:hypothetical protein